MTMPVPEAVHLKDTPETWAKRPLPHNGLTVKSAGCVQATAALHPYDVPVCAGTATGTGTGTGTGASSTGGGTVP